jgi:hypothetical protein
MTNLPLLLSDSHLTPLGHLTAPLPRGATELAADGAHLLPAQGRSAATDDAPRVPLSPGAMGVRDLVCHELARQRSGREREGGIEDKAKGG